jgi:hypothetical protein
VSQKKLTREFFRRKGREGGLKTAQRTTPEQWHTRGVKGMRKRWSKRTDEDLLALLPEVVRDLDKTASAKE